VRRFVTIALSLSLVLGLAGTARVFAQDEKKDAPKAEDAPKADAPKADAPKADAPKAETPKADTATPEPAKELPIPKEVEEKLEAARRAVAEAIVAAEDAGLVKTSIDPPPILDILITGRAADEKALKDQTGVSPEVFGAWYTGFGKTAGITATKDVRIVPPSKGLTDWYKQRAEVLSRHIKAVRDAKGPSAKKDDEAKPKDEPKKDDEAKKDEPKKDESK
jgi:hypothetical protein